IDDLFNQTLSNPQWVNDQFDFGPTIKYRWYCKIQTYVTYCQYGISPYCIVYFHIPFQYNIID
ncbi:unnamed protein product, partial [Rotaria sordida]